VLKVDNYQILFSKLSREMEVWKWRIVPKISRCNCLLSYALGCEKMSSAM
jgi:hypothetical protein